MEGCIAAYNAVYYHNMNATSREYAYFYDLTHTNGCASAFYDAVRIDYTLCGFASYVALTAFSCLFLPSCVVQSWLPYNQTWVYDEPCLGSLDGSGVKHECSGTVPRLSATWRTESRL